VANTREHLPCPCGKSSDAFTVYPNGGFCFSCNKKFFDDKEEGKVMAPDSYNLQVFPIRGLATKALQKYGVLIRVSNVTDEWVGMEYPYGNSVKVRTPDKEFAWKDYKGPGLFGKDKFEAGSAQVITITEGEDDALASYEMNGFKYPVVSVQSSGQAAKDCAADKEYLDSFEKIYLDFDSDDQGRAAVAKVSQLFPYEKIYVVKKNKFKDARDYLTNNAADEYKRAWWAAKRDDPENIISSFSEMQEVFAKPKKRAIASFPFATLQDMTHGIRTGETYLYKALEGIGKTEVLGAIEYHVAMTTALPIGIIHLEEDVQRAAFRFVGYNIEKPVHLEDFQLGIPECMEIYEKIAKKEGRINYYVSGKNDADVDAFLNSIRFMVAKAGCKIVFFDHISRVATAFGLDVAGLDSFATRLSKLALELDFSLHMITHVNDDGLTRGSRNISKEAWTVITLHRDKLNPDPEVRNTTNFVIEKNRHASMTGPAGSVYFNVKTFKISDEKPPILP
jgi:twinkle protein